MQSGTAEPFLGAVHFLDLAVQLMWVVVHLAAALAMQLAVRMIWKAVHLVEVVHLGA